MPSTTASPGAWRRPGNYVVALMIVGLGILQWTAPRDDVRRIARVGFMVASLVVIWPICDLAALRRLASWWPTLVALAVIPFLWIGLSRSLGVLASTLFCGGLTIIALVGLAVYGAARRPEPGP
ncbi:MAG: hypothetical protein AAF628_29145 [Planctomycetota bacterium]